MDTTVSDQKRVEKAIVTGLNKSLPTQIIKSDHIDAREHDIEK